MLIVAWLGAYILAGNYYWSWVQEVALRQGDLLFMALPKLSPWAQLGMYVIILTWPAWMMAAHYVRVRQHTFER